MRGFLCAAVIALAVVCTGCQTGNGSSGKVSLPKHGTLFVKVFNENANKIGAPEVQLSLDGQKILDRSFTQNAKSYDGQYQIRLPQGRHILEASTPQGAVFTSRAFNLKDKAFLQVYVTEDKKWHLTPGSKRSLVRLVIKRMRAARGINSDPALWMIIPAPKPSPATRQTQKRFTIPAGSVGKPTTGTTPQGGKQ